MGIDEKLNDEPNDIDVTLYLTSAPATSTFESLQDKAEHQYKSRKALLVEYDTLLEETLAALGVENPEEIALLFASGAEDVSFYVTSNKSELRCYHKAEDHATTGFGKDYPKSDTEARAHRRACVRKITYRIKKPDEDGRYVG